MGVDGEQTVHVPFETEVPSGQVIGPRLGPDDVKHGTRAVFPADNQIRVKIPEIEIRLVKTVVV